MSTETPSKADRSLLAVGLNHFLLTSEKVGHCIWCDSLDGTETSAFVTAARDSVGLRLLLRRATAIQRRLPPEICLRVTPEDDTNPKTKTIALTLPCTAAAFLLVTGWLATTRLSTPFGESKQRVDQACKDDPELASRLEAAKAFAVRSAGLE